MKLKRFLIVILITMICLTGRVLAATVRRSPGVNVTTNSIQDGNTNSNAKKSNTEDLEEEENEEEEEKSSLEQKLEERQKANSNSTNSSASKGGAAISRNPNTNTNTNTNTNKNTTSNTTVPKNNSGKKLQTIDDDVYSAEADKNIEYSNSFVNGNIHVVSGEEFVIDSSEVNGNVFVVGKKVIISNSFVTGSIYIVADEVIFADSTLTSIYVVGNDVKIDEEVTVENDIRVVGKKVYLAGNVERNAYAVANYMEIMDNFKIGGEYDFSADDYKAPEDISITENNYNVNLSYEDAFKATTNIQDLLPELLTEFGIILVISIVILGGAPKFTEVNLNLRRRDFFKAFFTGLLELLVVFIIAICLMVWGHGIGYAIALITLVFVILGLGKAIFVVAYSIRMIRNSRRTTRRKAFVAGVFVALVVQAFGFLTILGDGGFLISLLVDIVLGMTGFGTLVRVILSSKPKEKLEDTSDIIKAVSKEDDEKVAVISSKSLANEDKDVSTDGVKVDAKEVKIENVGKIEIVGSSEKQDNNEVKEENPQNDNVEENKPEENNYTNNENNDNNDENNNNN